MESDEISVENLDKKIIVHKFDRTKSISELLADICKEFNVDNISEYALMFLANDNDEYFYSFLTDDNKFALNSTKLYLVKEPMLTCKEMMENITNNLSDANLLRKLENLLRQNFFLHIFINCDGIKFILSNFINSKNNFIIEIYLEILFSICERCKIPSELIGDDFLDNILDRIEMKESNAKTLCYIYKLLAYFIQNFPDVYEIVVDSIRLPDLIRSLVSDNADLQIAILCLINSVFENTPKEYQATLQKVILEKNELRVIVYKYVLKKSKDISDSMFNEIFRLQNLVLYRDINNYKTPISMTDNELEEFKKTIQSYEKDEKIVNVLKKIGFNNYHNIRQEILQLTNTLILDCLTYYVTKNAGAAYYPEIGPTILQLISQITLDLAKSLKNIYPNEGIIGYLPMIFEKTHAFTEIICKILKNYRIYVKDFSIDDHSLIIPSVSEKVKLALKKTPIDFDHFYVELEKLDRETITQIMNDESARWEEMIKNHPPIMRLREFYAPRVEELIKKQTFTLMNQGFTAEYISAAKSKKGQKEEKTLLKLNSAFSGFEFSVDGEITTVSLSEISKTHFAEAALSKIDEKLLKKIPSATLVVIETKTNEKHAFSIEPTCHQIISDVISLAENKKIDDKWEPSCYTSLLDSIINIFLMDLSEKEILTDAPPIPEPPPNYDFAYIE